MKEKLTLKELFIRGLPLIIIVVSVGIFTLVFKIVMNAFYTPVDTMDKVTYGDESFTVITCKQNTQYTYYIYGDDYVFDESKFNTAGAEHDKAHTEKLPLVYMTLSDSTISVPDTIIKTIMSGNGLYCYQFGEFILYRLEGQYGILAPMRELGKSAGTPKNDIYVLKQLMDKGNYNGYVINDTMTYDELFEKLEKIEWHLTEN